MVQPDTRVETAQPPKRFAGWPPKLGQRFGTVRANGPKKGNTSVTPLWPRCSMLRSFKKCCASSIKDGKEPRNCSDVDRGLPTSHLRERKALVVNLARVPPLPSMHPSLVPPYPPKIARKRHESPLEIETPPALIALAKPHAADSDEDFKSFREAGDGRPIALAEAH